MLPGSDAMKAQAQRGAGSRHTLLQATPQPLISCSQSRDLGFIAWSLTGRPTAWGAASLGGPSSQHQPQVACASAQVLGPAPSGPASRSLTAAPSSVEVLRPRWLSSPVLARLIRSTTTLQELADVVAQHSTHFDGPLVSIAMVQLALLQTRAQKEAQRQARGQRQGRQQEGQRPGLAVLQSAEAARGLGTAQVELKPAAAPAVDDRGLNGHAHSGEPGSSSGNGNGNGNGNGAGHTASSGALAGASLASDGAWGSPSQDADGPLQMASIDDDAPLHISSLDDDMPLQMTSMDDDADAGAPVASRASASSGLLDEAAAGVRSEAVTRLGEEMGGEQRLIIQDPEDSNVAAEQGLGAPGDGATAGGAAAPASGSAPAQPPLPMAATLRVLLPLVFARLHEMCGRDVAAVLSALAALRFRDAVLADQLLLTLSGQLRNLKGPELANVLVAAALLGTPPGPDFRATFLAAARARRSQFEPRDLAMTLWAYGALRTDVQEDAVKMLLDASRARMAFFKPLYMAKTLQGLAALRYRPPAEWVESYCAQLRATLRRTPSRELCVILLALVSLQIPLDATTRATLLVHTLAVLPAMAPSELALALWALGRLVAASGAPALLDIDASARVLDTTQRLLEGGRGRRSRARGGPAAASDEQGEPGPQAAVFSAAELCQLLEGLTRLALQPPLEWMARFVECLGPQLGALEAPQLAGVLGSLAAQQYRPQPAMQATILAATQANMEQLLSDATCTASLLTALRRLSIEPPPEWVAALLAASRPALKNRCSDLHLAALMGALAAWGVPPDGRWAGRATWRATVLMVEGGMSPRALVAMLQAMVSLGMRPNHAFTSLVLRTAAATASLPAFEPHHYGTLLASLHALGVRPPQEWLTRMMLSTHRCWDAFGASTWGSMLPALVLLEARPPRDWLRRLEAATAPRLASCSPLQLLTLLVSLAQLHGLAAGPPPPRRRGGSASALVPPSTDPSPSAAPDAPAAALAPPALPPAQRPGDAWLAAWWAASAGLLSRTRYAPSELALTAGWLASLGLLPSRQWLQACADVAARYARVMGPEESQQLAAALAPLVAMGSAEEGRVVRARPRAREQQQEQQQVEGAQGQRLNGAGAVVQETLVVGVV